MDKEDEVYYLESKEVAANANEEMNWQERFEEAQETIWELEQDIETLKLLVTTGQDLIASYIRMFELLEKKGMEKPPLH